MNKFLLLTALTFLVFNISCKKNSASPNDELTVTDIDGNVYETVIIGDQVWMAENYRVRHYRNNDVIPNITINEEWSNISTGAYCSYNNDDTNINTYGLLYNWYTVDDARGLAPDGWHIPSDEDWIKLEMYLGMSQAEAYSEDWRGTDEGGKLKEAGTIHWDVPNEGATNSSGFSGLPGGYRHNSLGQSLNAGSLGFWWSSTEGNGTRAWNRRLDYSNSGMFRRADEKQNGFAIRCLKD